MSPHTDTHTLILEANASPEEEILTSNKESVYKCAPVRSFFVTALQELAILQRLKLKRMKLLITHKNAVIQDVGGIMLGEIG